MKFSRVNITRGDAIFIAIIFAGIAILSALLYSHSRARTTGSGKIIGKVFFKHEVAMRKFSNRMVWEDVENGSPLYSHDTIMTGNLSDAELALDSGLKLHLEANTLVELDLEDSGLNLRLSGGGIKTTGVQTTQTFVSTQNGQIMNVTDGAASIRTQGERVALEVKEGKVEVTQKNGTKETVRKDEIFTAGKKSRAALTVELPREDAIILTSTTATVKVQCGPKDAAKTAEITKMSDATTAQKLNLSDSAVTATLSTGDYMLRCAGNEATSTARHFRVVRTEGYKIYRPEKSEISFTDKPVMRLEFKAPQSVATTHIEVADNPEFTNPVFSQTQSLSSAQIALPKAGKYFYRLSPANEKGKLELQIVAETHAVTLSQSTTQKPLRFVSLTPPAFSLAQVNTGKAFIRVEGSGTYQAQIFKRGESAAVSSPAVEAGIVNLPQNLADGQYEMRLSSGSEKAILPFEVRDKIKVDLLTPENDTVLYLALGQKTTAFPLSWRGSDEVTLYQLLLAGDAAMKDVIKKINVEGKDFRFSGLTARRYYLKVLALQDGVPRAESAVHRVTIEEKLPAATGLYPHASQSVDVTKSAGLNLKWQPVTGATSYHVKIFQKRKGKLVLVDSRTTASPALAVANITKLREGDMVWEIQAEQRDRKGRIIQKSEPVRSHVNVSFGVTPPAPEIVPVVQE